MCIERQINNSRFLFSLLRYYITLRFKVDPPVKLLKDFI